MKNLILKLDKILEVYMSEIGGKIINYTENQSLIMIPTKHGRYQKVLGWTKEIAQRNIKFLEFDSKICEYSDSIDMKKCLQEANLFIFSRLIIKDGFLQVAASILIEHATPELIKNMLREVAEEADRLEFQITGKDIN